MFHITDTMRRMSSKGDQKRILKLLKSKIMIERLDALHELRELGEGANFAFNQIVQLAKKDSDDLVRVNSLDVIINCSGVNPQAKSVIESFLEDASMGVRRKAQKLHSHRSEAPIEQPKDILEEEPPLTNELFEKVEEQHPEKNGPEHGVQMDGPEPHGLGFRCAVGNSPGAVRQLAEGEVSQVVFDVFAGSQCVASHLVIRTRSSLIPNVCHQHRCDLHQEKHTKKRPGAQWLQPDENPCKQ